MLVFSFSPLLVLLFAVPSMIESGPLLSASSSLMMMNESTSMSNATLDSVLINDSALFYPSLPVKSTGVIGKLLNEDFSKIAIDVESGVRLVGPGRVKLEMSARSFYVKADLKRCRGKAFFCYDALEGDAFAEQLCSNNYCGFKLSGDGTFLYGISSHWPSDKIIESNNPIHMKNDYTLYGQFDTTEGLKEFGDASCDPAFSEGNILSLHVYNVSDDCVIEIPHAKVYHEPEPTQNVPSGNPAETTEASSEAGIPWYGWVLGVAAFLTVIGIIAAFIVCWQCKIGCFKGRSTPPKRIKKIDTDSMKSIVVKAETQPKKPKEKTVASTVEKTSDEAVKTPPKPRKHAKKAAKKEKSLQTAQEPTRTAEAKTLPSFTCEEPPPSTPIAAPFASVENIAPPLVEEKPPLPIRDHQEFEPGLNLKKSKRKHRRHQRQQQKKPPSLEDDFVPGSNMDIKRHSRRYRLYKEECERRKRVKLL